MTEEQKVALIRKVKLKCYITDNSDETEERILDIVDDAIISLSHRLGIYSSFDFSSPSQERSLFLNYCFYAWNDALDEFESNYLSDILQIRHKNEVKQSEESEEE